MAPSIKLWAYDDPKFWGKQFLMAAGRKGINCELFKTSDYLPPGPETKCFVRLDQEGKQREISKKMVLDLNNRGSITLPTKQEAIWYDDKMEQMRWLWDYLPYTFISANKKEALNKIPDFSFPFISKARDSSASKAVRLIHNALQAHEEVQKIFGAGIPSAYTRIQKGYVYWQEFLPNNEYDIRVVVAGDKIFGLIRYNRSPAMPFASGSGKFIPVMELTVSAQLAFDICLTAARHLKTRWMAFDVVFDQNHRPKILEMSSSWTPHAYATCPVWNWRLDSMGSGFRMMQQSGITGGHMFDMAVDVLMDMDGQE